MMDGISALRVLSAERTDQVVITHMTANHDWSHLKPPASDLDLHLGGAMGKASSLGLGITLARPDVDVWVLDGDGSLLIDRKSTRLNSSHIQKSRMPSSA